MKKGRYVRIVLGAAVAIVSLMAGRTILQNTSDTLPAESTFHHRSVQSLTIKQTTQRVQTPDHRLGTVATNRPHLYVNLNQNVYYSNRVVIVSFHDMSANLNSKFNMSPITFEQDLQALRSYHFNVISNQQYLGWLQHRTSVPANAVLLTFDDGYRSMYTRAFPILLKYHMPGTFFVITHAQDAMFPGFMTWPEVQAMARAGMAMESHTYDLHYLVNVHGKLTPAFDTAYYKGQWQTPKQYYARDYHDFLTARLQLQQHLHQPIYEIAWPYGYGNVMAYRAAYAAGYRYFFTTAAGVNAPWTTAWYIPRIDIGLYANPVQAINRILQVAGSPARINPAKQKTSKV